jgi:hypothetical protein
MPGSSDLIAVSLINTDLDDKNLNKNNTTLVNNSEICCFYLSNYLNNCLSCCFICLN